MYFIFMYYILYKKYTHMLVYILLHVFLFKPFVLIHAKCTLQCPK